MINNIGIGLIVEADVKNINSINKGHFEFKYDRYYEKELLRFIKNWRNNAGLYKDLPIYIVCITKNIISNKTKQELLNYSGIIFI
jgi:hypothetical protein